MSYKNPYPFINVNPNSPPKEVKRKIKDIDRFYAPRKVKKEDKISEKKNEKLYEFILEFNQIKWDLRKAGYNIQEIELKKNKNTFNYKDKYYKSHLDKYRETVYSYSKEKLMVILKANNLETSNSISKLITDVLENIPSEIAEINLWEFEERTKSVRKKINKLSANQIKRICKKLGLNTSGKKTDLIERIILEVNEEEIDDLINNIDNEAKIKAKLENLKVNELKRILELKSIKTNGNKTTLIDRIILEIDEEEIDNLLNTIEKEEKIKDKLEDLEEYKLKRILELKLIKPNENKDALIQTIISSINVEEINSLIENINNEYKNYETKFKKFKIEQLKLILSNENLKTFATQEQLIKAIFENISLNDIENKITEVNKYKEKALEKLYNIIGNVNLNNDFKEILKEYGIKESQFNEIKTELVNLINDYQISEKEVEVELNKRLQKKSDENEKETLNELYRIVGKTQLNPSFISKLENLDLDETVGEQIKKEMEEDIKSKKVSFDNVIPAIDTKIKQAETEEENEKLAILYNIIGENEINKFFKRRLEKNNLDEEFWLKLKNEMTVLIKDKSIKKEFIHEKIDELLDLEIVDNLLSENELSTLNQIAILKDFEIANNKDKQTEIILSHISERFNPLTIKDYINKIIEVKESLNKLFQCQIMDILEKTDLEKNGEKEEQINRILSNIHLRLIILLLERHEEIKIKLKESPLNYIFFILNENNLKVKGAKTKVINEIIKNVSLDKIVEDFDSIEKIILKLSQLNNNELLYIAETNNININNEYSLIEQIKENIDFNTIKSSFTEIDNVEKLVKNFNEIQRKHLLILSKQDIPETKEEQINSILLNTSLKEIFILDKKVKNVEKELDTLNVDQLNYILERNNKEPIYSKDEQINYILNNFLIEDIENNIFIIKEIQNQLNQLNDIQLNQILKINNIKSSRDRDSNILKIFNEVPIEIIKNNIIYIKNTSRKENVPTEIKYSDLYSPIRKKDGKNSLTTVRKNNLNLIPLFENPNDLKDFIRNKFSETTNIKSIKKDLNYFKKLISYQEKIDGLIIFKSQKYIIIKKEDL